MPFTNVSLTILNSCPLTENETVVACLKCLASGTYQGQNEFPPQNVKHSTLARATNQRTNHIQYKPKVMSKPKNWPEPFPYLRAPLHAKSLSSEQVQALRRRPSNDVPTVAAGSAESQTPCSLVKIQAINDATHPAHGQFGLFAARDLKAGTLIMPYLGRVHAGSASSSESDYDLWLDREADVAVDAAEEGNEGRFVNDYRGIKDRPNAEFATVWCERWGQLCVGVWVLKTGKKKDKGKGGIKKGEEILVSYGKGFWGERKTEEEQETL